jgi:peroxiredoxin
MRVPPLKNVAAICLILLVLLPSGAFAILRAGQPAPAFKLTSTGGQPLSLDAFRGKVLVVDFFATWCTPCKESIPHLIEMNRRYGAQGLAIIGMSVDEDGEKLVRQFVAERRITYPVTLAGDAVSADFGIRSVPVMFVIDKKGHVAEIYRGFNETIGRSMEQLVKRLLAEK